MEISFWLGIGGIIIGVSGLVYGFLVQRQVTEFKQRFKQFFGTKKNPHLNAIVMRNTENMKKMNEDIQKLYEGVSSVHEMAIRSTQKVGVHFYNPYGDAGGTFSFSVAFLDANDSGVIVSSLHAREGTRVYAKEISKGKSSKHLTGEEIEALRRANLEN